MNKKDFQIFDNYKKENKAEMVYLDSAASSLTPDYVVNKMNEYYFDYRSNIDRGLYKSAIKATYEYEESRKKIAIFTNANDEDIIFTSSSTDSSNKLIFMLEKYLFCKKEESSNINRTKIINKKEILVSTYSHHSDLVPLQELANRNNLKIILCKNEEDFINHISENTLILSCVHASNVTGQIFDVKSIFAKAKSVSKSIFTICDMTASAGHIKINIKDLGCDAAYFGAHKMCGPTGIGALYIKREIMREMLPASYGGGMVWEVSDESSTFRSDIKLFEAGTGNIAGVIGFGAAVDYINNLGKEKNIKEEEGNLVKENKFGLEIIRSHTKEVLNYALSELSKLEESGLVKLFTEKNIEKNIGIISFEVYKKSKDFDSKNLNINAKSISSIHPHDVAQILADNHAAVRSGHHCAQPLMRELCVPALTRASFYFYNTKDDVDALIINLKKVQNIFSR